MLNLAEYRGKPDRLADLLPWAALVGHGVVLNKDGGFQRTFRFRGPDLDSAGEAELIAVCARVNNALKRLGSGWALFFDAERMPTRDYPRSTFPDAASWLVDEERRAAFEGNSDHFESRYHLTLFLLPPADAQALAERAWLEGHGDDTGQGRASREGEEKPRRDWRRELERFREDSERVADLLAGVLPEMRGLDDAETLTFLHATTVSEFLSQSSPLTIIDVSHMLLRIWCGY